MAQNKQDKKGTLINELDSLRYTLNSGPEFQQDIPTLNEQHHSSSTPQADIEPQCDLFRDSDGIIHDLDLDVPILTDTCEEKESGEKPVNPENSSEPHPNLEASVSEQRDNVESTNTETPLSETEIQAQQQELHTHPDNAIIDVEQLSHETDSSVMELEQVLDELVAEQLPKLEQQLREKLRRELETDIDTKEEPKQ